jgi:hypothetical protein
MVIPVSDGDPRTTGATPGLVTIDAIKRKTTTPQSAEDHMRVGANEQTRSNLSEAISRRSPPSSAAGCATAPRRQSRRPPRTPSAPTGPFYIDERLARTDVSTRPGELVID